MIEWYNQELYTGNTYQTFISSTKKCYVNDQMSTCNRHVQLTSPNVKLAEFSFLVLTAVWHKNH